MLLSGPTIYTVNVTTDSNPTSGGIGSGTTGDFRYAISQAHANTNPAGSVIQFDPRVFNASAPRTITPNLSLYLTETAGPEVIEGPGANILTIDGNNAVWTRYLGIFSVFLGLLSRGETASEGARPQDGGPEIASTRHGKSLAARS